MKEGRNTQGRNNKTSTPKLKKISSENRSKRSETKQSDEKQLRRSTSSRTSRSFSGDFDSKSTKKPRSRASQDFTKEQPKLKKSRKTTFKKYLQEYKTGRVVRSSEVSEGYVRKKHVDKSENDRFERKNNNVKNRSSYIKKRFDKQDGERSELHERRTRGRGFKKDEKRMPRLSESSEQKGKFEKRYSGKTMLRKIDAPRKFSDKRSKKSHVEKQDDTIRLNRYISNAGICSRREADVLIESGEISVNGTVITEMGYKVKSGDTVKYGNRTVNREKPVYVLMNKPKGYITTTDDPEERKIVTDILKGTIKERIYPVGRLDRNTTGLLLLTNDGELAEKLSHPSNEVKKIYQVELDKPVTKTDLKAIVDGLQLEDGLAAADEAAIVSPDKKTIGIEIHIGRNRIVRRMFEYLGYTVLKLDRVMYAGLTKKDLSRGSWRFLTEKEVIQLKYFV